MNQYEREEEQLDRDLAEGLITRAEHSKLLREMMRDAADEQRGMAEEAAERAYDDVMGRW